MSYPYAQDRHIDRKEKGEQPYKDAKEAMARQNVEIEEQAEAFGEARSSGNEDERNARVESDMEERFAKIGDEAREADRS